MTATALHRRAVSPRAAALAARFRTLQQRLGARLHAVLLRFFRAQSRRVVRRYLSLTTHAQRLVRARLGLELRVAVDQLIADSDGSELARLLQAHVLAMLEAADGLAVSLVGGDAWVADSPRVRAMLASAVYYPDGITPTTARVIEAVMDEGMRRFYSPWQIAHGVPRDGFVGLLARLDGIGAARAETITRTVMAFASQQAAHERYAEAGVAEVDILDGDGCGWTSHADTDKANGSRRTLAAARAHPISHPRCRRVSAPVLPGR